MTFLQRTWIWKPGYYRLSDVNRLNLASMKKRWNEGQLHTECKESRTRSRGSRTWNSLVKSSDISSGSSDESGPCVDSGQSIISSRDWHCVAIGGESWQRSEHDRLQLVQTEHSLVRGNSQKLGWPAGMLMNSISPVKSDEFVPPSVKTPPGSKFWVDEEERVSQNDISGAESWLLSIRACQNGTASVLARDWKANPIRPETGASTRPVVIASTDTRRRRCQWGKRKKKEKGILNEMDNYKMFELEL